MSFSHASDIVELVVLSVDEGFLQTLREAVGGSRRLWHVATADKVSDLLVAGQVGILVLDVQALQEPANVFLSQLKRQFPDLVILVAGKRDAETSLADLISAGTVYRLIHKPMSPDRARLFADAAVRKYSDQRRRAPLSAVAAASPRKRQLLTIGVIALIATVIAITWPRRHASPEQRVSRQATAGGKANKESPELARAAAALADNRLTAPGGDNALELYLQALARNPSDPAARAGLAEVHERLLSRADSALLEERLDEAAGAIETARKAGVDRGRIALLTAQLAKARGQLKSATAQLHRSGDAHAAAPGAEARLARALELAAQRMQDGRLIEPDHDNARFYVREALRIDPDSRAAQASENSLATILLSQAHDAIERRDFARAVSLLDAANGIAPAAKVENLLRLLRAARKQAETARASAADHAASETSAPARGDPQPSVVDAGSLTLVKSVRPLYPRKAELARMEGWVELEFTVAENGEVREIHVPAASPPGIFDSAAVNALSKWRYVPVLQDARPVAQRARLRIRFALTD